MNPENRFSMFTLNGREVPHKVTLQKQKRVGDGSEVKTDRTDLIYGDSKKIKGMVAKKYFTAYKTREELREHLKEVLSQWSYIRNAMVERKKVGKITFKTPKTIRGYEEKDKEIGILMTDLTQGGKNTVIDLKDYVEEPSFDLQTWEKIKSQLLRDVEVAREERIVLTDLSLLALDPWLVVYENHEPVLYFVDVGEHTRVNQPEAKVDKAIEHVLSYIQRIDKKFTV